MIFPKTQLGWRLMRQSLRAFGDQKKLLIFPSIGKGIFFSIFYVIFLFAWLIKIDYIHYADLSAAQIFWIYIAVLLILFIGNIISAYCNSALILCLRQYEFGSPIQLKPSFIAARRRLKSIFLWLLIHFTVGLTLMIFRKKTPSGLQWPAASFFMEPLITNEPSGIARLLRRSSHLMINFSGSDPTPRYSFFWISKALYLLAWIPGFLSYYFSIETPVIWTGLILTAFLLILAGILSNAFHTVFMQALYQYAAYGKTSPYFKTSDLASTFSKS